MNEVDAGLTRQRRVVLELVRQSTDHPTAGEIYKRVSRLTLPLHTGPFTRRCTHWWPRASSRNSSLGAEPAGMMDERNPAAVAKCSSSMSCCRRSN